MLWNGSHRYSNHAMMLTKSQYEFLAISRGAGPEAWNAATERADGLLVINTTHPDYPYKSKWRGGPGWHLKAMLSGFPLYIKARPGCRCNNRALLMDVNERREPGWCEEHIDTIVGWLRDEHARQGVRIPFVAMTVRQLVRLAIRRARKKGTQR